MNQSEIDDAVRDLNEGAQLMLQKTTEMQGARLISKIGQRLADAGGKPLLERVHALVSPEYQRTVELQWYGLTDSEGRMWLP